MLRYIFDYMCMYFGSKTCVKLINHVCMLQDPPMCLCIDSSSVSDIELEGDGIWKVFGGKVDSIFLSFFNWLLLSFESVLS